MQRPPAILGAVLVLALAVAAAACASSEPAPAAAGQGPDLANPSEVPVASATGPAGVTSAEPPTRVPEILRFETPLVGGGTLYGSELAGSPVALWFWAPW
jgi:hypothetical protein